MARTPVAVYVVRLASRLPSTDGTRFDHKTDATRAKPHAPPFSAHPVFGPSRGVGRPVRPATARRDDTGDTQARIRRMRLFASVRARLSATDVFASSVSSVSSRLVQADPRHGSVSFSVERLRRKAAARRRSETRAGTSSRKRASSATPRSKRAGLATLARLAPATWRASRRAERTLTRTNDEANLPRNARAENIRPVFTTSTFEKKPFAPLPGVDARAPPSFSKRIRACAPRASPSRAPRLAGTSCGSRSACGRSGVVFLRGNAKRRKREGKRARVFSGASSAAPRRARRAVKSIATENAPKTLRNRDPQPQNRRRLYRRASLPKRERFVRRRSRRPGE